MDGSRFLLSSPAVQSASPGLSPPLPFPFLWLFFIVSPDGQDGSRMGRRESTTATNSLPLLSPLAASLPAEASGALPPSLPKVVEEEKYSPPHTSHPIPSYHRVPTKIPRPTIVPLSLSPARVLRWLGFGGGRQLSFPPSGVGGGGRALPSPFSDDFISLSPAPNLVAAGLG